MAGQTARQAPHAPNPAGNWKPSKKKSRERIDGIVALIMALDRASRQEEFRSVYDKRGPLFLTMSDEWVEHGR
jgi:phage terminase large subunit-like protein